jgi:NADH:ubiquinone reductase (H+-translocating)
MCPAGPARPAPPDAGFRFTRVAGRPPGDQCAWVEPADTAVVTSEIPDAWWCRSSGRHRVVIVGAGFGGLYAARALRRAPVEVIVLDRHNHHTFQPLLYQVATAALNATDIAAPIRRVLRKQKNTRVMMEEVRGIDVARKVVVCRDGELAYDSLILATGATHSYFGRDDWAHVAPGLKSIDDALEMRRRVLLAFEAAEREDDPRARAEWLTFVLIGGGPTGVELAGALTEVAHEALPRDFRRIDSKKARVILLEGTPRVLPQMAPELSESARRQLEHLGVEVRTGAMVTGIDEEGVLIGQERIRARTVLWGAGVAASPLGRTLGAPVDRFGRVLVEPDLTVPGHPDVHVIGDLAAVLRENGKPVPGVAAAAIQEGKHAAANIVRTLQGRPREAFRYRDKGTLATIGRGAAVADLGRLKLSGTIAWLAWLFVHLLYLVGFRNRLSVLLEWGWSYLTFERGARLITGDTPPPLLSELAERDADRPSHVGTKDVSADGQGRERQVPRSGAVG